MSEFKQSEMIRSALEGVKSIVDSNTVLGQPIVTGNDTTIIPISKVSVGLTAGGLDYFGKNAPSASSDPSKLSSFGGGGGTGITVTPVGFLVVKNGGSVELLTVDNAANKPTAVSIIDAVTDLINNSPEIAEKIKEAIAKFKTEEKENKPAKE